MNMLRLKSKYTSFIALCLAIIIHLIFIFLSTQIFFENKNNKKDYNFIKLSIVEHHSVKKEILTKKRGINRGKNSLTKSSIYQKVFRKKKNFNEPLRNTYTDTLISEKNVNGSINKVDSFLLRNSSITVLKLASKEKLKNYVSKKSVLDTTKRRIEKAMSDYYKSKYPTPPYKFGERGTGNLINIPVEDVIELFK